MNTLKTFEENLVKIAKKHQNMVVLNGDFSDRLGVSQFISYYPERSFKFGLSERSIVLAGIGFLLRGKLPVIVGFSSLLSKSFDVLVNEIVPFNLNVKFVMITENDEESAFLSGIEGLRVVKLNYDSDLGELFGEMLLEYGPAVLEVRV